MFGNLTPALLALPLSACCFLPAASYAQATLTYTAPSGYTTETLEVGFNFVGLTLHNPVVASGTIDSVTVDTTLTDNDTNFDTALGASGSALYILRILDDTLNGTVAEISTWSGNNLTTSGVTADFNGRQYEIRKAVTIDELFGGLLSSGSQASSDKVWLPQPDGSYNRYFLFKPLVGDTVWRVIDNDTEIATDVGDVYLNYLDAFFVEIKSTPKDWVLFGDVLTTRVVKDLPTGFVATSVIFPVATDLVSLGLEGFLTSGSQASADYVWSFNTTTSEWDRYFLFKPLVGDAAWNVIDNATETRSPVPDPGAVVLGSAIFIQRKGAGTNGDLTAPPEFSTEAP